MKKTILITGASSGIGKAAALYFANKDWNVIATMRQPENESELKENDAILVTKLDVEDKNEIHAAIQTGIDKFGKIDALLNNAGYGQHGIFEATSSEQIHKQFAVNLFGTMEVTRAILPHFRSQKGGTIVNVTSGVGRVTVPLVSIYAASKFALEGFTESLYFELASQNIKVKIIEPGSIKTNFEKTTKSNFAQDNALVDYAEYLVQMDKVFSDIYAGAAAEPDDVAATIFEAVTDGKEQLRYVIGADLQPLIDIRNNGTDEAYMDVLRQTFIPKS